MEEGQLEATPEKRGAGAVLLADDEELFLDSTRELLRRDGYACDTARDSQEAMLAAGLRNYDVLITDINMPGNENLELVDEFVHRFPNVPVIVVTGYPSVRTAVGALRLTAVDYMVEPVDFVELRDRIAQAISTKDLLRVVARVKDLLAEASTNVVELAERVKGLPSECGEAEPPQGDAPGNVGSPYQRSLERLSDREREIVRGVLAGRRASVIAPALGISPSTVRNHLKNVFRKLGVHSQVELVSRLGRLLPEPDATRGT